MHPKDLGSIANSEDPDQPAPLGACSLIWVCTVCPDLSVRKLTVITVYCMIWDLFQIEDRNTRLNLAYQNLKEVPEDVTARFGLFIEEVDLTNNRISYPFYKIKN